VTHFYSKKKDTEEMIKLLARIIHQSQKPTEEGALGSSLNFS
jgi:hypothetical protein